MRHLTLALAASLPSAALGQEASSSGEESATETTQTQTASQYVGRYDGNSFETAMGMIVREDGTFDWGLSVGGLDLQARGRWTEVNGAILFKSEPKPVAPQFTWSGVETTNDGPFLRIVSAESGEPFRYADVRGLCANGEVIYGTANTGEWSPDEACDKPETIELYLSSYQVLSGPFELRGERAVGEGQTGVFDFHRNDLGVADFDGVMGWLEDGKLRVESSLGAMTLRKLPPPKPE
ncbi:MAG: hypothetical protein ABJ205_08310 [Erythrobacter sp.]|uniref:hypothetical protein n=1 Tax=Erythrobacter sp. TaxID=1042 RepID=UPI0032676B8D